MKHLQRLLSLFLALLLCLSALSVAVLADDAQAEDSGSVEAVSEETAPESEMSEAAAQPSENTPAAAGSAPADSVTDPSAAAETPAPETETVIASEEPETVEEESAAASEDEQPLASDEIDLDADGVYGSVISSASDSRIAAMLALIDDQNFTGSGITAAQAKAYVNHFLYTSNFKAIGHGVYIYPNSGSYTTTVSDGTYTRSIYGSKGCMSYCRFVSKVFYGTEGSLRFSSIQSAASLKSMLQTYGQAGDHIRMGERHSVTFISCDDNGFYCLSYQGDSTRYIYLEYWPYSTFVAYYSGSPIGIYDANRAENTGSSGSTPSETGESTLSISDPIYPSGTISYGQSFSLGGTITSNYTLTDVTAYIRDTNGNALYSYSSNPASKTFIIQNSVLDNTFKFGSLAKGSYTYTVTATDSSGNTVTLISSSFACGSASTYTVTYNANGGSGAPSAQTKNYNEDLVLSQTIPTRQGMKFLGWATSSSAGTFDYAAGAVYNENKSITLYAVWSQSSGLQYLNGKLYYLDENGNVQTGFRTIDGNTYYFNPDNGGCAYISKWLKGTSVNYFGSNGVMYKNGIYKISSNYYYFDTDGALIANGWFERNNCTYYAYSSGKLARGIKEIKNEKYYFNESCALTVGWAYVNSKYYYFEESTEKDSAGQSNYAQMVYGWKDISGKTYYFDDYGVMQTGWVSFTSEDFGEDDGSLEERKYYFDSNGAMVTGWQWIDGYRYYFNKYDSDYDGEQFAIGMMVTRPTGWFTDPDTRYTYYLDSNGRMLTGLQHVLGQNYYFSESTSDSVVGSLQSGAGWLYISGNWYYINSFGEAVTGFQTIGQNVYYFNSSSVMLTGWQWLSSSNSSGAWYYFNTSGAMATGWLQSGSTWYYLKSDGAMANDEVLTIGSTKYAFKSGGAMVSGWGKLTDGWHYSSSSGAMQTGWLKSGSTWYYLQPAKNGLMASDTVLTIGGANYAFKSSGAMVIGWGELTAGWYYSNSSGVLQTGWLKSGSTWYYLKPDKNGLMANNQILTIDGSKYAFQSGGAMISGWGKVSSGWYYSNSSGVLQTGWLQYGNNRYYLQPTKNGKMCVSCTKTIDGVKYQFDSSGICTALS